VVIVIMLFLLHARSALVPLATLPVVLLLTFLAMRLLGVPATIHELGRDRHCPRDGRRCRYRRASSFAPPAGNGAAHRVGRRPAPCDLGGCPVLRARHLDVPPHCGALVFAGVRLSGETGRLLRPLALTKTLVVISAALVTLTLAPRCAIGCSVER